MITEGEKKILIDSISSQVNILKQNVADKSNFKENNDWKKLSVVKEGEDLEHT